MKIFRIAFFAAALLFTGCQFFEPPEGVVELAPSSVHTRSEMPSATEEVIYCSADVKITNTGTSTIYDCTVSAVATSDKGIQHFVSMHYNVNIPPSQSLYVTLEWRIVKHQIVSTTKTSVESSSKSSVTNTESKGSSSNTTTTTIKATNAQEETGWNKSSVKVLEYFFN